MPLPEDFVFSQSALQDYAECARRFELRYVRDVRWPALETQSVLAHEAQSQRGQNFHHLLHHHALGVPAEVLEATLDDEELRAWWQRYLQWQTQLPAARYPELTLTAPLGEQLLMAQYDLIVKESNGNFLIVDWKTGKPAKRARLAERMQTLVYPYVLSQAGAWLNDGEPIPPERIRMVYWFATDGSQLEFAATAETMLRDEARLSELLHKLTHNLTNDAEWALTANERACRFCVYRSLCERGDVAGSLDELEEDDELTESINVDFDAIEEIAF